MPVGYLVTVAILAVCTGFALTPIHRPRALANLSFRLGLVINEMPFLALAWLGGATALAFAQGDLDSPGSMAIAGLAAVTAMGLGVVARRGARAASVIESAMVNDLGTAWRAGLDVKASNRRPRLGRILFAPFLTRRFDVERIPDIAYGEAGRRNLLDVYRHRSRPQNAPVFIHLHGGGYFQGRKNSQSLPLLYRLASQGWVCVSANYRLRPGTQHPGHLIDYKKVIAWVREHGHEYGADPAAVFASGSSAGGHMSLLCALTPNDPAYQPGFENIDTSVVAAVSLNGYYGNYYGQGEASSPHGHLRADAPPVLLVHGDNDTVVPAAAARQFAGSLRNVSHAPVVYTELPGAQHAFDLFHSLRFEAVVDAVEAFSAWALSREKTRG